MQVKTTEQHIYKINGRTRYFNRIVALRKVSATRVEGETCSGIKFTIEGGKKAGGSARDWFLDVDGWQGSINCTSLIDALECINGA